MPLPNLRLTSVIQDFLGVLYDTSEHGVKETLIQPMWMRKIVLVMESRVPLDSSSTLLGSARAKLRGFADMSKVGHSRVRTGGT